MATHWTLGGDATDPHRLAAFWALALGYVPERGYDEPDGASRREPPWSVRTPTATCSTTWVMLDPEGSEFCVA